jgi:glutamate synthase (NADPH/NADH)
MANLGIRKFQDLIGRTDLLRVRQDPNNEKSHLLDLKLVLKNALEMRPNTNIVGGSIKHDFQIEKRSDYHVIERAQGVLDGTEKTVNLDMTIRNEERAFGATLSYHIALKYGEEGLPNGSSININLRGSAGQSFGAFLAKGVNLKLIGDANDYVGKGLSGGNIVITPPEDSPFESHLNVIVGNVCLYGATSGKAFFRGIAAERFCVRNSGATAVVEGVGDHGCEYMTGGVCLILSGNTGRNFAAGMSGGIAYVYDPEDIFVNGKANLESVELVELDEKSDRELVRGLLEEFVETTGSVLAKDILNSWPGSCANFVKVFPFEYQAALKVLEEERQKALDEEEQAKDVDVDHDPYEPKVKDIEEAVKDSKIEKRKMEKNLDKVRGFIKYKRETGVYRDATERQKDWKEIYNFNHVRKGLKVQAARCMECGVPFCQSNVHGCPLGNIIPKWNDLVFQDRWKDALLQLLQTNNFPEFTGRVCPAPCEGACVLGISEPAVTIKNIECSIIDYAFEQGWIKPEKPSTRSGKKVAIIGSGPAGLAAAQQLNRAGHTVTVFERNDRPGGLLQYGIPTMKLGKDVVMRRIDLMEAEGIMFKCNVNVGTDINPADMINDYDAVLITTGSTTPRDLTVKNRGLNGVHFAMEFLEANQKWQINSKRERISAEGKDVIVIGGGDTGCDCIATSLRQGAKSITSFEILPTPPDKRGNDNPWPQWPRIFR